MKSKLVSMTIAATMIIVACQKNDMMTDTLGVDIKKYEKILNTDYSNALVNHNVLKANSVSATDHNAYHGGTATTVDTLYFKMMFNKNDSLFSQHFYEFCIDMMQNSGMMSTSNNMMGNNSNMMGGNGGMMNGSTMGSMADMAKMMSYMDSIHNSTQTMMIPYYMKTDGLMYNQMTQCKMMVAQTDSIKITFGNMQMLRGNHKTMHK